MKQEDFAVEQFMDTYETGITYNLGETCCDSITINDIINFYDPQERDHIRNQLQQQLFDLKLVYGYIKGSDELKTKIANVYNSNGDIKVTKDDIVITNGAIGANFLSFYSLIDPDDKIIAIDPCYQQLSSVPNLFSNGNLIKFDLLEEENYQPNLKTFEKLVNESKPKLVVLNNPHNPTGAVWSTDTLKQMVDICKPHGTYILCDEVYRPLFHSTEEVPKSIVDLGYENTISTGSMSKAFSMAGIRLGWIVSKNKNIITDLFSKRDYNTISVSMVDDVLSQFALSHYDKLLERNYGICQNNLKIIQKFIDESNGKVSWVKPTGGSTCLIKFNIENLDTMKLCQQLATNHKTLMVPGEVFGRRGYARIGFGNGAKDISGGLEILKTVLNS